MIEKLNTLMTILSALGLLRDGVKNYIDVSVENSLSNGIVDKLYSYLKQVCDWRKGFWCSFD